MTDERIFDAVSRMQHWVKQYGSHKPQVFTEDITILVALAKERLKLDAREESE